jgi:hypothetical protein
VPGAAGHEKSATVGASGMTVLFAMHERRDGHAEQEEPDHDPGDDFVGHQKGGS